VSTARRDPEDALRAILLTLAPAAFSPVTTPELLAQRGVSPWVVPGVVAALLAGTGLGSGMPARLLGTAGLLLGASSWVTCHLEAPGLGALVLMGAVALLSALWPAADGSFLRGLRPAPAAALTAAALVLHGWTASLLGPLGPYGVVGAVAVAAGVGLRGADGGRQLAWVAGLVPVAWGLLHAGGVVGTQTLALLALAPAATLARTVPPERVWRPVARVIAEVLLSSPPRLLVSTFAVASLVGTFALSLPVADVRGRGLSLVDAAFDAVSAVTLTGLVATPRTNLTAFGQLVTFGLFQVGALAVMTLAAASAEASRRAGPRAELSSGHLLGHDVRHGLLAALRRVGTLTAAVEGAGALLLLPALLASGHGLRALWEAPFLAASAFCGARAHPVGREPPAVRARPVGHAGGGRDRGRRHARADGAAGAAGGGPRRGGAGVAAAVAPRQRGPVGGAVRADRGPRVDAGRSRRCRPTTGWPRRRCWRRPRARRASRAWTSRRRSRRRARCCRS
jgi:hypothetical protein